MEQFKGLLDLITSAGAIVIPFALYYIKSEISKASAEIGNKLSLLHQKLDSHILTDEGYQERTDETLDRIKNNFKII